MKKTAQKFLVSLGRNVPLVATAAHYIHYRTSEKGTAPYYRELFVANGRKSKFGCEVRAEIAKRFEEIDQHVPIASTSTDGYIMAEAIMSADAEGDIVECGCYAGASSAKLSIVAHLLGRKLVVCDSFEGLPEGGETPVHTRRKADFHKSGWRPGDYSAGLEAVRSNIAKFGEISVCSFVEGWFNQTLTPENLPAKIAAAFTDVDLHDSARDCLVAIWPLLSDGGIFFSHDVAFVTVLQELLNEDLWVNQLKSFPPIFFGAGFGVCDRSTHLGYMVKGAHVRAEYLKNLTLDK